MGFLLLTDEMELHVLRMAACRFDPDLKEAHQNQLRKFSTELSRKSRKTLQKLGHLGRENMIKPKTSEVRVRKHQYSLRKTELEKKRAESAQVKHCSGMQSAI